MSPRIGQRHVSWLGIASLAGALAGAFIAVVLCATGATSVPGRCVPLAALFAASLLAFESRMAIDASDGALRGSGWITGALAAGAALFAFGVVPLLVTS